MAADSPNRTVLIVEDAESCATTLEIALLAIPHMNVRVAPTARQALDLLAKGGGICAVVTDLNLPSMDGFELIERVRSNQNVEIWVRILPLSGMPDPRM